MANILMEGRKRQDLVTLVLAVCLFISPWVMGFRPETMASWNVWLVAIVLGALATAALSVFAEWEEWANLALGAWLIVSPWILGFAANAGAMWTAMVVGVLVAAVSLWALWDVHHPHAHA